MTRQWPLATRWISFGDRDRARGHGEARFGAKRPPPGRQDDAASISSKLAGLSAAHADCGSRASLPAGRHQRTGAGGHLVEGLLMAGGEMFDAVDEGMNDLR